MASTTTQEFTLHLPPDVVEMLRRAAKERRQTPEQIVAESLRFSLHPVRQEALRRLQTHIRQQQMQTNAEQVAHLEARLSQEEQHRLSQLLERNRTKGLRADEQEELQSLFDRIEAVATEKAAAMWLLSDRASEPDAPR